MDKAQALTVVSGAVRLALGLHAPVLRVEVPGGIFDDVVRDIAERVVDDLYKARREEDRGI